MNSIVCFYKETKERLLLSSPSYFKKIKYFCFALAAAGIYLKTQGVDFNIFKTSITTILIGAGGFGTFLASLPIPSDETNKLQNTINSQPTQTGLPV